jgi:hypothetical protein
MKSLLTLATIGLISSSAFAGSTTFSTNGGAVKVQIEILGNEDPTISDFGFAPGSAFQAVLTIENRSSDRVDLAIPILGVQYPVNDQPTQHRWGFASAISVGAGANYRLMLNGIVPLDADVGSRFKVGLQVGLASSMEDMRTVFASVEIVRGLTDNTGGAVGTISGSGASPRRRVGGGGSPTNQAPAPRRDADPNLPTRRHR